MARVESTPPVCAQCGAEIPPRAHACPECGADEHTGWRETSIYDGLDLPETEHPAAPTQATGGLPWYGIITAVTLLLILLLTALGLR